MKQVYNMVVLCSTLPFLSNEIFLEIEVCYFLIHILYPHVMLIVLVMMDTPFKFCITG